MMRTWEDTMHRCSMVPLIFLLAAMAIPAAASACACETEYVDVVREARRGHQVDPDAARVSATCEEMAVAAGWVYARHGYVFEEVEIQSLYRTLPGYVADPSKTVEQVEAEFTPEDIANVRLFAELLPEFNCNDANETPEATGSDGDPEAESPVVEVTSVTPAGTTLPEGAEISVVNGVLTISLVNDPDPAPVQTDLTSVQFEQVRRGRRILNPQGDCADLWKLRGVVYARHGLDFQTQREREYFEQFDWYRPDPEVTMMTIDLYRSPTDVFNLDLIRATEIQAGCPL